VLAGIFAAPCYLASCLAFRSFQIDDPLENCQIYILPVIWGTFNSVLFLDGRSVMVTDTTNLDLLGTQLLGLALISILVLVVSWGFFFPMKRLDHLRVSKSTEVIGRDTIMNAESKGLDLDIVIDSIEKLYPAPKKRGC
jgi:ammonia channel protein AmtB